MWTEKRYAEQNNWQQQSGNSSRAHPQMTPRSKHRPNPPLPQPRRSITPSRVQERVAASPLRLPLERAIEKCAREKSTERPCSRSRLTNKSSRQGQSSVILRRGLFEQEESLDSNRRVHTETVSFLKKYFDFDNPIALEQFVERIVQDYGDLWDNRNVDHLMDHFSWKMVEIFGECIEPRHLIAMTRDNGIIGLILQVFQSINESEQSVRSNRSRYVGFSKSPNIMSINKSFQDQVSECVNVQHLKNILQEFLETMYREMEKEIYDKFNAEMKRMVLKHREADRILKKINEKLTHHADYFEADQKWQARLKNLEEAKEELTRKLDKKDQQIRKEKEANTDLRNVRTRLEEEVQKLKDNNEKYQMILLNKFETLPGSSENTLPSTPGIITQSRKVPSNGALADRTLEFHNQGSGYLSEPKPFQIKIDTHFFQRDSGPPHSQTTTTFTDQMGAPMFPLAESSLGPRCHSPIKLGNPGFESGRPSYQPSIKAGTKIGEFIYSPYQCKVPRPY